MSVASDQKAPTLPGFPALPTASKRHRPGIAGWLARGAVWFALAWVVLWFVPGTTSFSTVAAKAVIWAIVGLSLNIIIGYTGQLSLGHQGFYGLGAFAAAYTGTVHGVPFAATFVIAMVVAGGFAALMGLVALRISGLYLALITAVFGITLAGSLFEVEEFTNRGAGQPATRPEWLATAVTGNEGRFYLFCLAFLALAMFVDWRMTRTKTGRALLALKENERVAEGFGVNVTSYKLLAFVVSGAMAGVAGALYAYLINNVTSIDFEFLPLALTFVLMVVVGGLGSRVGVILGSVLFATLDWLLENVSWLHSAMETVTFHNGNWLQYAPQLIGALGLLLTLVLNPGGIAQQIRPLGRWLAGHPFSLHHDNDSGPGAVEGSSVRA